MTLRHAHSIDRFRATRRLARILACLAAVVSGPTALGAAEYCVACSGPDARYRCAMDGAGLAGDTGAQLACIQDIARRAGHATCAIDRTPVESCNGTPWTVAGSPESSGTEGGVIVPRVREAPPQARQEPSAGRPAAGTRVPGAGESDTVYRPMGAEPAGAAETGPAPRATSAGTATARPDATAAEGAPAKKSALEKVGEAIGSAAKKSWSCVSSLFSDC